MNVYIYANYQLMEIQRDYKVNRYFFLGIILLFAVFLLISLAQFFVAFLAAVVFYVLSKPLVEWLIKRWHWRKGWAAVLVIMVSFFIILLPISVLIPMLYNKIGSVATNPAELLNKVKEFDKALEQKFNVQLLSDDTINSLPSYATTILSAILKQSVNFFTTITMMYFFLYFMIQNINRMEAAIVFYLPFSRSKIFMFGTELVSQTFSNAVGIPLIAVVQGICAFGCYYIVGVNDPGFWGVITGFTSVIPIVGTGIIWVPMAAYLLITGEVWQGCFVIGWSAIIVGSVDNIIRFALAKRMADVHPIVTVLGVIIGLDYFGFIGIVVGPLLISYFLILLRIYYVEYQKPVKQKPQQRHIVPKYMHPIFGIKTPKRKK